MDTDGKQSILWSYQEAEAEKTGPTSKLTRAADARRMFNSEEPVIRFYFGKNMTQEPKYAT